MNPGNYMSRGMNTIRESHREMDHIVISMVVLAITGFLHSPLTFTAITSRKSRDVVKICGIIKGNPQLSQEFAGQRAGGRRGTYI